MPEQMDEPPRTEDSRVDAALQDLAATPDPSRTHLSETDTAGESDSLAEDLDAVLAVGEDVHRRLTARLSDLGT